MSMCFYVAMSLCHKCDPGFNSLRGIIKYPIQGDDYNNEDSLQARLTEAAGELVISISRSA